MRRLLVVVASFAWIVLAACGGSKSGVVGTWVADQGSFESTFDAMFEMLPPEQREKAKAEMRRKRTQTAGEITFLADGTYVTSSDDAGKAGARGTWKQEGDQIILNVTQKGAAAGSPFDDIGLPFTYRDGKLTMDLGLAKIALRRK